MGLIRGGTTCSSYEDLPAKSSQYGTLWPTGTVGRAIGMSSVSRAAGPLAETPVSAAEYTDM